MRLTWRTAIWAAVIVQVFGFAIDGIWHGFLKPGFEPRTTGEMVRHLTTVHLVLYLGVLGLLVTVALTLVNQARQSSIGLALPLALAGAVVQTAGETWHAYSHLRLRPSPTPEIVAFAGLVVAIVALVCSRPDARRRVDPHANTPGASRRAAGADQRGSLHARQHRR
jgi:hypothetical protein